MLAACAPIFFDQAECLANCDQYCLKLRKEAK